MLILADLSLYLIINGLMNYQILFEISNYLISTIKLENKRKIKVIALGTVTAVMHALKLAAHLD
jgi:hypothetical protein